MPANDLPGLIAFGVVIAVGTWLCVEIFRRRALKKGYLDFPNERSSHTRPTPRGGGIAIVFVCLAVGGVLGIGLNILPIRPIQMGLVMGGAVLIAAISWLDDVRHGLPPAFRLLVHVAGASLAIIAFGGWDRIDLPFFEVVDFGWGGIPLAVFWIVGLVNAYNFMDGIDGIAGVQAVTAAAGWTAIGLLSGSRFLSAAGILIGFSAIGFLFQNWPPAKIFMGDVGSAFLGYSFAVLPFCADRIFLGKPQANRLPVAGFLMVAPFVLDALFTLFRRIRRKEKLSQAHRSHLYQRLVLSGLSHRAVTLLYLALGLIGSSAGIVYLFLPDRLFCDVFTAAAAVVILIIPLSVVLMRENRPARLKKSP